MTAFLVASAFCDGTEHIGKLKIIPFGVTQEKGYGRFR